MTHETQSLQDADLAAKTSARVGFFAAVSTAVITLITFVFAMFAIPISGANCPGDCIAYPYLDSITQYPRDYLWMLLALLMMVAYIVLMVAIHYNAAVHKKIYSQIGLSFAIIAAVILLSNYFVQYSVVPISLMSGETEGIPLLTQYNAHGIFIALEELGYLVMSLSFLCLIPLFSGESRVERTLRWIFIISVALVVMALILILLGFGLDRQDRFEVFVISINWFTLIINGGLLSTIFRKRLKSIA